MSKEYCADCGGPREPGSSYASYCMGCGRKRQRNRYREMRAEGGHTVTPRVSDDEEAAKARRAYLMQNYNKPGSCELCDEHSEKLKTIYLARNTELRSYGRGEPLLLVCSTCEDAATLSIEVAKRAGMLLNYLARMRHSWEMVFTDKTQIDWTISPSLPHGEM